MVANDQRDPASANRSKRYPCILPEFWGRASNNGRRWRVIFVNRLRRSGSCQRVNLAPKLERYRLMRLLRLSLHVFQLNVFQLNKVQDAANAGLRLEGARQMDRKHQHDACGEIREPTGGAGLSVYIASKLPVEVQAAVVPRAHLVLMGPTCREAACTCPSVIAEMWPPTRSSATLSNEGVTFLTFRQEKAASGPM